VLRHWLDLPTHGGMHDIDIWYYGVSVGMHYVDVAMGIGISILILLVIICHIMKNMWC
jgi:hypothetical protein